MTKFQARLLPSGDISLGGIARTWQQFRVAGSPDVHVIASMNDIEWSSIWAKLSSENQAKCSARLAALMGVKFFDRPPLLNIEYNCFVGLRWWRAYYRSGDGNHRLEDIEFRFWRMEVVRQKFLFRVALMNVSRPIH